VVLMESVKCLRKTSDEAPLRRGGGKNNAPLALPQQPALRPVLNLIQVLFQGRLLFIGRVVDWCRGVTNY